MYIYVCIYIHIYIYITNITSTRAHPPYVRPCVRASPPWARWGQNMGPGRKNLDFPAGTMPPKHGHVGCQTTPKACQKHVFTLLTSAITVWISADYSCGLKEMPLAEISNASFAC